MDSSDAFGKYSQPAAGGHFGKFGGAFVPETLVPALQELEAIHAVCKGDPEFQAELNNLLRDFVGRPPRSTSPSG